MEFCGSDGGDDFGAGMELGVFGSHGEARVGIVVIYKVGIVGESDKEFGVFGGDSGDAGDEIDVIGDWMFLIIGFAVGGDGANVGVCSGARDLFADAFVKCVELIIGEVGIVRGAEFAAVASGPT